jgi:hypothetical protein
LNLRRGSRDYIFGRGDFLARNELEKSEMPKAVASTIPASYIPTKPIAREFDFNQLAPIALFSGIGLLVSLVAILSGMQGAWY